MSITSDRVNYLIWRYLQEEGLALSALALGKEASVASENDDATPRELVGLIQKGLIFSDYEVKTRSEVDPDDTVAMDVDKSLIISTELPGAACCGSVGPMVALGTEELCYILSSESDRKIELNADTLVTAVGWTNSAKFLVCGTFSGQVRVWDCNGVLHKALSLHRTAISTTVWNKNSSHLLSVDCNSVIGVWDMQGTLIKTSSGSDVVWIDNRTYAASAGREVAVCKVADSPGVVHAWFRGHNAPLTSLAFDPCSQLLASGGEDGEVNIWHGRSQSPIRSLAVHAGAMCLQWVPDLAAVGPPDVITSRLIVGAGAAGVGAKITCWDINNTKLLWTIETLPPILFMALGPDGKLAVAAKGLRVYKLHEDTMHTPALVGVHEFAGIITGLCWVNSQLFVTTAKKSYCFAI